ncbi:hypothetical protein TL16_g11671 [Triparma laevis f. inornata]|uniref:Sialate O-acetylesterase domain-containing protein n=1 Tax=Triparma laevis f. inornata TaxID=1714386 RepID=A0A9W7EUA5_9STRA|nr:hypothetical protein TL16_g11671 [Triparma laevis f. inornata]
MTIFGWALSPSVSVSVTLTAADGKKSTTTTNSSETAYYGAYYRWDATLPPSPPSFSEYSLTISSETTSQTAEMTNLLFGDVFFCSGQSNMQFSVEGMLGKDDEIAAADDYGGIRMFGVGQPAGQLSGPQQTLPTVALPWTVVNSKTIVTDPGNGDFDQFSAVCYMSGRHIFTDILKSSTPVGLISSNWGGTPVEAWMPEDQLKGQCDGGKARDDKLNLDASSGDDWNPNADHVLYDNMITPFEKLVVKAAIWYQGETNVGYWNYDCFQSLMVESWRKMAGWGDMAFTFVQLAAYDCGGSQALPDFRGVQLKAVDITPNSAMITAADLGDVGSPDGDIHPRNKTEVGRRLSLAIDKLVYNKDLDSAHMGPVVDVDGIKILEDGVSISFRGDTIGGGLHLEEAQVCPNDELCGNAVLSLSGNRGDVVIDDVVVVGNSTIELRKDGVDGSKIVGVSYGWGDFPLLKVFSSYGVPAAPFKAEV